MKFKILIALMLFTAVIAVLPQGAVSVGAPTFTYDVNPKEVNVTISPDHEEYLEFTGVASCDYLTLLEVQKVSVTFSAEIAPGWGAVVDPPSAEFSLSNPSKNFTIYVTVPINASFGYNGLTFTISWRNQPGVMAGTQGSVVSQIHCSQYWDVEVPSNLAPIEGMPDSTITGMIKVKNTGNGMDSYNLKIKNDDYLRSINWYVTLNTEEVTLDALQTFTIYFDIQIPPTQAYSSVEDIIIEAESIGGHDNGRPATAFGTCSISMPKSPDEPYVPPAGDDDNTTVEDDYEFVSEFDPEEDDENKDEPFYKDPVFIGLAVVVVILAVIGILIFAGKEAFSD